MSDLADVFAGVLVEHETSGAVSLVMVDAPREDCPCVGRLDVARAARVVAGALEPVEVPGWEGPPLFVARAVSEGSPRASAAAVPESSAGSAAAGSPSVGTLLGVAARVLPNAVPRHQALFSMLRELGVSDDPHLHHLHDLTVEQRRHVIDKLELIGQAMHR